MGDSVIENTEEEKLLGVVISKRLTFETHISKLCKKAGNKVFALARISGYMDSNKLRILMRAFVISQFQYCPLVWMFHSRHLVTNGRFWASPYVIPNSFCLHSNGLFLIFRRTDSYETQNVQRNIT